MVGLLVDMVTREEERVRGGGRERESERAWASVCVRERVCERVCACVCVCVTGV